MLEVLLFEGGKEELKEKGVEVLTFTGFYGTLFEEDNHAAYTDPAYVVAVVRRSQRVYMARWDYSEGETWVEVDLNPGTAVQVLPPAVERIMRGVNKEDRKRIISEACKRL